MELAASLEGFEKILDCKIHGGKSLRCRTRFVACLEILKYRYIGDFENSCRVDKDLSCLIFCKSFLSWSSRYGHKQILHLLVSRGFVLKDQTCCVKQFDMKALVPTSHQIIPCLVHMYFFPWNLVREVASCRFHQQHEQQQQQQQRQRCSYSDGICNGKCFTIHQQGRLSTVVFFSRTLYIFRCVSLSMGRFF